MLTFPYARACLVASISLTTLISGAASAQNVPLRIRVQTDQIEVQPNGAAVETLHTELQVLTAAAVTQLGQVPIGYIESMQDVDVVEAHTLKGDGRKISV